MNIILEFIGDCVSDPEFQEDFNLGDDIVDNISYVLSRPLLFNKLLKGFKKDIMHEINLELTINDEVTDLLDNLMLVNHYIELTTEAL